MCEKKTGCEPRKKGFFGQCLSELTLCIFLLVDNKNNYEAVLNSPLSFPLHQNDSPNHRARLTLVLTIINIDHFFITCNLSL